MDHIDIDSKIAEVLKLLMFYVLVVHVYSLYLC